MRNVVSKSFLFRLAVMALFGVLFFASAASAAPVTVTANDTTTTGLQYTGMWGFSYNRGFGDFNNDVHYTSNNNDYFIYTFKGDGIALVTEKYSDQGNIEIILDGGSPTTVNTYNATRLVQQAVFQATGLANTTHTLKVTKKTGTYMVLDALIVYGPRSYELSADFSSTQGSNNWTYESHDGTNFTSMSWNSGTSRWNGTGTYNQIWSPTTIHPDANASAVSWKVPADGIYRLTGTVKKAASGGDGVHARITVNNRQVWPELERGADTWYNPGGGQYIYGTDTTGFAHDIVIKASTNDVVHFIVWKNATITSDSTSWNPKIEPALLPFTIGAKSVVLTTTQINNIGMSFIDNQIGMINNGSGNYDFFTSSLPSYFKFSGSAGAPSSSSSSVTLTNGPSGWSPWIVNVYKDPATGHILGIMHLEKCNTKCKYKMGLAYSKNGGATFRYIGDAITQKITDAEVDLGNGDINNTGGAFIIKDGYLYLYYADTFYGHDTSSTRKLAVARALYSDVQYAGENSTSLPAFKKYYNGTWTEPGIGGNYSSLEDDDRGLHSDISYNSYLGKYIMLNTSNNGMSIKISSDPLNWRVTSYPLYHNPADKLSYYGLLFGTGTDNRDLGQTFYAYFADTVGAHLDEYVRFQITLD